MSYPKELDTDDIDHIDHLVASHYDADHIGGHAAIIEEFGADNIGQFHGPDMSGISDPDTNTWDDLLDVLNENAIEGNELHFSRTVPPLSPSHSTR